MSEDKTVLSIQSFVTHGYVGNKAATFPLQLHGFDVDGINTVSLSNHSGYPIIRGHRIDLQEYEQIMDGLRGNNFLPGYRYVLTGYINNADIVRNVYNTVAEIRALREKEGQKLTFFCDPVMGDDGRMYCKEEVVEAYRELLQHADVLTPNYYEAELLSGIKIVDTESAIKAADWFHERGTKNVIIKSFRIKEDPTLLRFVYSRKDDRNEGNPVRFTGLVPYHEGRYTGTGDVFAATLLAFAHELPLEAAIGKTMGVLQDLIIATRHAGGDEKSSLNCRELRVTKSPNALVKPSVEIEVTRL